MITGSRDSKQSAQNNADFITVLVIFRTFLTSLLFSDLRNFSTEYIWKTLYSTAEFITQFKIYLSIGINCKDAGNSS